MNRIANLFIAFAVLIVVTAFAFPHTFQKSKDANLSTGPLLKHTTTRTESSKLGFGGSVTIVGAPQGSITVEGWSRSEVEVVADIELQGPTEQDLDLLAKVNSFAYDEDTNHISILTTGTHDRAYMRRAAKNFPKRLLNLPWRIDYRIHVPSSTDVEIDGGRGAVTLSGVEGAIRLSASESETSLNLTGGVVSATVTAGKVRLTIPVRSWRGSGADIRVATGKLEVELPPGFNGDIDADILRTGKILNTYGLEKREKPGIGEQVMRARAGAGGAFFKFTMGDGTIEFKKQLNSQ
ncbi:MAG: hypothetical protein ABR555_07970 [Pyrinomonadaceae bacterium]